MFINQFILSFFSLCSVLVYDGYTKANNGPGKTRLKYLPYYKNSSNSIIIGVIVVICIHVPDPSTTGRI